MRFKRGFAKKSLVRIITRTVLTIGAVSLSLGLSCQEPSKTHQTKPQTQFQTQPQTQTKTTQKPQKYFYSKLENLVYDYVDKFSRKIPQEFIKTDYFYYDPTLIINENFEIEFGKGRLVYGYDYPETIVVGYGDKEKFELYNKSKDPNTLNNISFGRMVFNGKVNKKTKENLIDEIIILNKKNIHVIYLKTNNKWKKGVCEGSYDGFDPDCQAQIRDRGEIIPQEQVQKYIDLSDRFKRTYFKRTNIPQQPKPKVYVTA